MRVALENIVHIKVSTADGFGSSIIIQGTECLNSVGLGRVDTVCARDWYRKRLSRIPLRLAINILPNRIYSSGEMCQNIKKTDGLYVSQFMQES
jgi:hypothetical protein